MALQSWRDMFLAGDVLDDAERHADSGRAEAVMPVDALPERSADQRRDKGAEVDAHVEDGKAGVAPYIFFRVKRSDDAADVRLQQPGSDDDGDQARIKRRQRWVGHHEMAGGDDDPAEENRSIEPEK